MPLIQIRYNNTIDNETILRLRQNLPAVAAATLSREESTSRLAAKDIMLEFDNMNSRDTNAKDIHIRVWAHNYPSRYQHLDQIRKSISEEVLKHIAADVSWYVWVLLAPTSYGSDTEG